MTISETGTDTVDLDEAARQLEQAAHDARVAYDSIGLGNLDWAHTYAITAPGGGGLRRELSARRPGRRAFRWTLSGAAQLAGQRCTRGGWRLPGTDELGGGLRNAARLGRVCARSMPGPGGSLRRSISG
jgi:hypothetical protein